MMRVQWVIAGVVVAAVVVGGVMVLGRNPRPSHYTGFVEGEERILRSEMQGRLLEVRFAEGAKVEPSAVIAVLDDRDIQSRTQTKKEEIKMLEAEISSQEERVEMIGQTSQRNWSAAKADLRQAQAAAELAERSFGREQELVKSGASTAQLLDDARSKRDQAKSALDRARQMVARAEAELGNEEVAQKDLETMRQKRQLAEAELAGLEVEHSKYSILSPGAETIVQTQFAWPGELARPGTAILSVIDPRDKYVQIYVPVADVERFHIGQRVEIELDSSPGRRVPGEVSFLADKANFTPEKIETRSDRMGQVYRAKIRILQEVERFQPGTEGNVYLVG